jgi:hypothetical protein
MFENRGIKARHLFVWPGENIPVLLEEGFVGGDFLRNTCSTNGDFLYNSISDGNIGFDGRGNVGHVAFLKSIRGRDGVAELVDMPWWDKILGFDCVYGVLARRRKGFLWKKERSMV